MSWRIGRPSPLPFTSSPPRHLVLSSWHNILAQAHTSVLSGEMHALADKSPTVSLPLRFLPRAPFVYSTPSIMQGLISQSRFELQHAWTKRAASRTFVPVEVSPSHWLRGGLLSPFMPLALIFKPSGGSEGIEGGQERGGGAQHCWESLMSLQLCRLLSVSRFKQLRPLTSLAFLPHRFLNTANITVIIFFYF